MSDADQASKTALETRVRYIIEQRVLPSLFYDSDGQKFVDTIVARGSQFLESMYLRAQKEYGEEQKTYSRDLFSVQGSRVKYGEKDNEFFLAVQINMPTPERATLARRVFLCFAPDMSKRKYLLVEKSLFGDAMLCGVDEKGNRRNYGAAPDNDEDEMRRVAQLFVAE